ncbi:MULTISPECIES: cation:proton antiporter domain-containing protein [Paenibacillus]|uniref:cation:proton antiporter domain-containing protein n=1 Tax=Paenibacillus TaxID=44249 RepID=UPI0022B8A145|nr:cation:proton antiporter [Paenibacillus caseinilyticus]MCZ8521868.1 cation:proton antiporter [Paenibacillus caseinilyticus]
MEHSSIGSLILVVLISFLIPILLYQLRLKVLPVVVAEIAAGILIGKSGLQLVGENDWLEILSLLGFIYLMFLSGLEIDFSSFKPRSPKTSGSLQPVVVAVIVFSGIFLTSGALSTLLYAAGLVNQVGMTTLIICTISLGVVVPVLKERRMLSTPLGQILLLVTVLADLFTMVLLAVYVSARSRNMVDMLMLCLFFVIVFAVYYSIRKLASGKWVKNLQGSSVQFGTRGIFALLLAIVFLSESLGVENTLGAFLAGVMVSLMRPSVSFTHQLESFGYGFLIPIFFVMVGVKLDLAPLLSDRRIWILIPLLLVLMFLAKLIPMFYLKKWFTSRETVSAALLLSSKLSLVIAAATLALELNMIDERMHGAFILSAILSCLLFPVLFNRLTPQPEVSVPSVSIVGMNHITLPAAADLRRDKIYEIRLFSASGRSQEIPAGDTAEERVSGMEQEEADLAALNSAGVFHSEILVFATSQDEVNMRLGMYARNQGGKRIIVRIESPHKQQEALSQGFEVFSTLFASRMVLRAQIENPGALQFIAEQEPLGEVTIQRMMYSGWLLKDLPMPPNLLVLRIYRGQSYLIPHAHTEILFGDRLLVSGEGVSVEQFRQMVSRA